MPQMSPLWWLIFPVVMVMVVVVLSANLFDVLMNKGEVVEVEENNKEKMWW